MLQNALTAAPLHGAEVRAGGERSWWAPEDGPGGREVGGFREAVSVLTARGAQDAGMGGGGGGKDNA